MGPAKSTRLALHFESLQRPHFKSGTLEQQLARISISEESVIYVSLDGVASVAYANDHTTTVKFAHTVYDAHHIQACTPTVLTNLVKPPPYENKEKPGKFIHFERRVRQFIRVQGSQPEVRIDHNQQCRIVVEICCHFTHDEETDESRKAMDNSKLTKGMSARTYVQKFNSMLGDVPNMSMHDTFFAFNKGLPHELQVWLRHDAPQNLGFTRAYMPQNLEDAQNLVIRMSGSEPAPTAATPEPMQLGSIQQNLRKTTARLARLEMGPRQDASRGRDITGSTLVVTLVMILAGQNGDGHPWQACPHLKGQRSPSAQSLQERSPSPPGSWRAHPSSPPRARPNAQGPCICTLPVQFAAKAAQTNVNSGNEAVCTIDIKACVSDACAEAAGVHKARQYRFSDTVDVHSGHGAQASGPFALETDHLPGRFGDLGSACVVPKWATQNPDQLLSPSGGAGTAEAVVSSLADSSRFVPLTRSDGNAGHMHTSEEKRDAAHEDFVFWPSETGSKTS
eukprot:1161130-Pelagomonas_calceolata.AAC.10